MRMLSCTRANDTPRAWQSCATTARYGYSVDSGCTQPESGLISCRATFQPDAFLYLPPAPITHSSRYCPRTHYTLQQIFPPRTHYTLQQVWVSAPVTCVCYTTANKLEGTFSPPGGRCYSRSCPGCNSSGSMVAYAVAAKQVQSTALCAAKARPHRHRKRLPQLHWSCAAGSEPRDATVP